MSYKLATIFDFLNFIQEDNMHTHEKTLQPRYSTHRGFSFLFYCQQCFECEDEWLNVDEMQHRLNSHADLLEALELLLNPYEGAWLGDDNDSADPDGSIHYSKSPRCKDIRLARQAIEKAR